MSVPGNLYTPTIRKTRGSGYIIEGSGLFDGSTGFLSKTWSDAGSTDWTIEVIVKRGTLNTNGDSMFGASTDDLRFYYPPSAKQNLAMIFAGNTAGRKTTTQVFRDPAGWMQIIWTSAHRCFINGVEVTDFDLNATTTYQINTAVQHTIGVYNAYSSYFTGYMARATFLDGTAVTDPATDGFGEFDDDGFWNFTDVSGLTFGTYGFLIEGGTDMATGTPSNLTNPADGNTKLLIHSDDADTSTTFVDSAGGKTITVNGDTQHDTAQMKFGGSSIQFDGTGDQLYLADHADFELGSGDFTIALWVRWDTAVATLGFFNKWSVANRSYAFGYTHGNGLEFNSSTDGTTGTYNLKTEAWSPSADTWYHVAVTKSSNNLRLFVDGTELGTATTDNRTYYNGNANLDIGGQQGYFATAACHFDELLLVNGTAIWTSNFTPPTSAYDGIKWAVNGTITATNDSPTDDAANDIGNYATLNPNDKSSNLNLSEGNLTYEYDTRPAQEIVKATIYFSSTGKFYWEQENLQTSLQPGRIWGGIHNRNTSLNVSSTNTGVISYTYDGQIKDEASSVGTAASWYTGERSAYAVDCATGEIWIGKVTSGGSTTWYDNTATGGADPAAGTSATASVTNITDWAPCGGWTEGGSSVQSFSSTLNFGQLAFHGTVPTGFKPLCTAHLPAPTIKAPPAHFGVVTDTETNIVATLAAATEATNYVRVYKNRDNIENWYWQFSHDSSNAYSVTTNTSTSGTFPTLSGSDAFLGFEFNCDTYFKTGSVSHTNGADTTVTHNAGNATAFIMLFDRTSGGDIYTYHPEFTSGDLCVWNDSVGEVLSSVIKNVTANAFDIDTGESTGTYDYLVIPEIAGMVSLAAYTGNGSTDGPFIPMDLRPALSINHRIDAASGYDWALWNAASSPYNAANPIIFGTSGNAAESFYGDFDILSNGRKERTTGGTGNASGGSYITVNIAEAAFGGADVSQARAR